MLGLELEAASNMVMTGWPAGAALFGFNLKFNFNLHFGIEVAHNGHALTNAFGPCVLIFGVET